MIYEVYIFKGEEIVEIFETKRLSEMIDVVDSINQYAEERNQYACWRVNFKKNEPYETIRKEIE